MTSDARQKSTEKLNTAQKCSILGPQKLGSQRGQPRSWIRAWYNYKKGHPKYHLLSI